MEFWGNSEADPWGGLRGLLLRLDDEVEVIMGEGHFISQTPWK